MGLNDYINIADKITGTQPPEQPPVNRSEQVNVGLEFAKRQSERQAPEQTKIPPMGTTPLAN